MAVHIRLKDSKVRGAKFYVNEGKEGEYSFETSYGWANDTEAFSTRNNDKLIGSYMYGIKVTLKAGENTIKITEASCDKTQHFRSFYFRYDECATNGHVLGEDLTVVTEPTCAPGKGTKVCTVCNEVVEVEIDPVAEHTLNTVPTTYNPATCTVKGSRIYVCTTCGGEEVAEIAALGHKAGDNGVCTQCEAWELYELTWNEGVCAKVNTQTPPTAFLATSGWRATNWINKDDLPRNAQFVIKAGYIMLERLVDENTKTARGGQLKAEQTPIILTDEWWGNYTLWSISTSTAKTNIEIWVPVDGATEAEHLHSYTVVETIAPGCFTAGKWDLTCSCGDTKTETVSATGHTHPDFSESNKCLVCGEFCEYPVINTFDYSTNYLAPVLPEKFKDAVSVSSVDAIENKNNEMGTDYIYYDEVTNTSGGKRFENPDPFISVYVTANEGAKIEFVVTVPETGVYEFAIHTRLSSSTQRGFKVTTNEGTENETVTSFDFKVSGLSTDSIRDHVNTKTAYLYGASYKLNLVAGPNTVTFSQITAEDWLAGEGSNNIYIRNLYFVKVADWTAAHEHTWGADPIQTIAATCTDDGAKIYKCSACNVTKTEVVKATGHVKGELVETKDPTCASQRVNIYDCTACDGTITELNATGSNARLNHTLDADNKCTTCGTQFKVLDLGWTAGKYWDNKDIHALYTMKEDATLASTKVFTTNEIPVGAIIKVKAGYDGKIDGWDQYRNGFTNVNNEGRDGISTWAVRSYWNDKGADFTTQLDPTLGTRYRYFYFTVKREDGKAITAEELAEALVVLVPTK